MFRKACVITAIVALALPVMASATNGGHWHHPKIKKTVFVPKVKKSTAKTAQQISTAISAYVPVGEPERAGYCSPVPIPRPYETDGVFYNGYADDASRAFYHSIGLVDAKMDPVTGSIGC